MALNKKSSKIILIITAGLILAALITALTVRILLSPERIRRNFEAAAEGFMPGDVSIEAVSLRPGHILLKGVSADFKGGETYAEGYFRAEQVAVMFRMLPLLRRQIVFTDIIIDEPVFSASGNLLPDLSDIFAAAPYIQDMGGHSFQAGTYSVRRGRFIYRPEAEAPGILLEDINLSVSGSSFLDPVEISLGAVFAGGKQQGSFEMLGSLELLRNRLNLRALNISSAGGVVNITGRVDNLFSGGLLNLQYSFSELPSELFSENLAVEGEPVLRGEIKNTISRAYINWLFDLTDCGVQLPPLFRKTKGENLKFRGGATYENRKASVNWYVAEFNGSSFSGTGSIDIEGALDVNLTGDSVDIRSFLSSFPTWRRYIASGAADIRARISGGLEAPVLAGEIKTRDLSVRNFKALEDFLERMSGVKKQTVSFGEVTSEIQLNKELLDIKRFTAVKGDIEGNLRGKYYFSGELDFTIRPEFYGRYFTIAVYGSTDSLRVNLK